MSAFFRRHHALLAFTLTLQSLLECYINNVDDEPPVSDRFEKLLQELQVIGLERMENQFELESQPKTSFCCRCLTFSSNILVCLSCEKARLYASCRGRNKPCLCATAQQCLRLTDLDYLYLVVFKLAYLQGIGLRFHFLLLLQRQYTCSDLFKVLTRRHFRSCI